MNPAYQQTVFSFISSFIGQSNVIPIQTELVRFTGDYNTAALLTQLIYWQGKQKDPDGWIYKTYEQWEKEIALSKFQTSRSVKTLIRMGILETKVARVKIGEQYGDKAVHYRLLQDKLIDSLGKHLNILDSQVSSLSKVKELNYPKSSNSTILPIITKTTIKDNNVLSIPDTSSESDPIKETLSPCFNHDVKDLLQSIPEDKRTKAIEILILKALIDKSKEDIKLAIAYTIANSKGTKQQFKAYLGKTLDNGWHIGFEPEPLVKSPKITESEIKEDLERQKIQKRHNALNAYKEEHPEEYQLLEEKAALELGINPKRLKPGETLKIRFKIMMLLSL